MSLAFDAFAAYIKKACGIIIEPDKLYLVESRLQPILKREGLSGLPELVEVLTANRSPAIAKDVIEAMTINETYFFRDKAPFDKFRDIMLPKLAAARQKEKKIRIWSAASSTGQEAYSLSMIIEEMAAKLAGVSVEIVGTDLAEPQLNKAREGKYTQFEVQRGLTTPQLLRNFQQRGDTWHVKDTIKSRIQFRQFNLMTDYAALGRFDIVFCRNVLIYFEPARKSDILKRISKNLAPDGFVVLGASESVLGLDTDLVLDPEHRCFMVKAKTATPATASSPAKSTYSPATRTAAAPFTAPAKPAGAASSAKPAVAPAAKPASLQTPGAPRPRTVTGARTI